MVATGQTQTQTIDSTAPPLEDKQKHAEKFRTQIETSVLKIIKNLADKGETPTERLQEMAKNTLLLVQPGMTMEELYRNAVKLDDNYSELAPVVMEMMRMYEETYNKKAVDQVTHLIREGKLDQAQDVVKKVLLFKIDQ